MRHPPLQPGWIDAAHHRLALGSFGLESGERIERMDVSYVIHGELAERQRPIVLGLCAIGSTHHRLDFLIGPGRGFDPARCTVIVVDAIGNGLSSSPSNSRDQPGRQFPRFTIRDMVRSQRALLDQLGVRGVDCVVGASMGGMQALQWGVLFPGFMRRIVAMTPMAKTEPWAVAMNHAGRLCLAGEQPNWQGWVTVMQVLAMRTPARFARDVPEAADVPEWVAQRAAWWATQQSDPLDWTYQSRAYDAHDVGTTPGFEGATDNALRSIRARTLICTPQLDLYNPVEAAQRAANAIPDCRFLAFDADSGHLMASDADPQAASRLNREIARFMAEEDGA
jgi:homoserine O-acetyltransferase/O-succinyltransferase